jgi:hypothetical protein
MVLLGVALLDLAHDLADADRVALHAAIFECRTRRTSYRGPNGTPLSAANLSLPASVRIVSTMTPPRVSISES